MFYIWDIGLFFLFGFFLSNVLVLLSYILTVSNNIVDKLSPYECGFEPFNDARQTFDIKFILVAIIFLVFDLEICYLFPWAVSWILTGFVSYGFVLVFMILLTIGFYYEYVQGGLEWQ